MEALELEARAENKGMEELIVWMMHQHIPALLDVIEIGDERRKRQLSEALMEEEDYSIQDDLS